VASVSGIGEVVALSAGSTTITVETSEGAFTDRCEVRVVDPNDAVAVTGVTLDKHELTLPVGGKETLTATVAPENATIRDVSWSSSDPLVASVSATGEVAALKAGRAIITVTTDEGDFTDDCLVVVSAQLYNVTVTQREGGNVTATIAGGAPATGIPEGTQVTLTATADDDYTFLRWIVTGLTQASPTDNPLTFAMPAGDVTVEAEFEYTPSAGGVEINGVEPLKPTTSSECVNSVASKLSCIISPGLT
jgi:uncharacterized protein YjdB